MAQSIRSRSRSDSGNEPEPVDRSTSTSPSRHSPPPGQEVGRAQRRGHAPRMCEPIGPHLIPAGAQRVNYFVSELNAEIRGRERFHDFTESDSIWGAGFCPLRDS